MRLKSPRIEPWCVLVLLLAGTQARADDVKASFDENGFTVRTAGDAFKFELGGRFHTDFGAGGSGSVRDEFPDAAEVRRLWIEPTITLNQNLILDLQYAPSSPSTPINNLLLSYKGMGLITFTGGNFKEPFSLEQLTSNNDTTFMERSLADAFAPARNTGFAIGAHGDRWTASAGVFGGNINRSVGNGSLAGTARVTYAPMLSGDLVHLGLAGSYRSFDRGGPTISFDSSPESFLFKTSLVDTDTIKEARTVERVGAEFAWTRGPFRLQSEYIATRVGRDGAADLFFQGGYVYTAWVLNGKAPKYTLDAKTATEMGVFKRVEPESDQRVSRGGIGVFELAFRYSAIDLSSRDVRGGFEQDVTVGLNWYPEPFVRVLANYIHAWADPTASIVTGRPARADIAQLRIQVAF